MQRVLSFLMVSVAVLLAAGAALLAALAVVIGAQWVLAVATCDDIVAQGLVATCPEGGD